MKKTNHRYLVFWLFYFSILAISISQYKIIPLYGSLAEMMGVSMTEITMFQSVFTLASIVMAFPGAAIVGKYGTKRLLIVELAFLCAGNLLGAVSLHSYPMMLVARTLEGVAYSMMIMIGVVLCTELFSVDNKVGTMIGIFSTFIAISPVASLNLVLPAISIMGGNLNTIWLLLAGIAVVLMLLILVCYQESPKAEPAAGAGTLRESSGGIAAAFQNGRLWLLAIAQAAMIFMLIGFTNLWPTLYSSYYGLDVTTANWYGSICGLMGIWACPLAGVLVDKFRSKLSYMIAASYLVMGIVCLFTDKLGAGTYLIHPILIGTLTGLTSTGISTLGPTVAKKAAHIPYMSAFINFIYAIGNFAGSPATAGALEASGWGAVGMLTAAANFVAAACMILYEISSRNRPRTAVCPE